MRTTKPAPFVSILLFPAALAAQAVWTVGPAAPAQFAQLQAAVAAAADGDVILVAGGSHGPVTVDGKGLSILGTGMILANSQNSVVPPALTVRNLAAHQRFVLQGMTVFNSGIPTAAMLVQDCVGPVWLQDVFLDSYGAVALRIDRCADAVLVDSFVQTNSAPALPNGSPSPAPGARIEASRVYSYDTDFRGSHGTTTGNGLPAPNAPTPGGPGLIAVDAWVEIQGGELHGGGGVSFVTSSCTVGGQGGDALVLMGAGGLPPEVRLRDVNLVAGHGGYYVANCSAPSLPGALQTVHSGAVVHLSGDARSLRGGGRVPAGQVRTFHLAGRTGDVVFVVAAAPALPMTFFDLPLHVHQTALALGFATIGPSGQATLAIAIPPLPVGMPALATAAQALFVSASGVPFASSPTAIVVR